MPQLTSNSYITCKSVRFYCLLDEDNFFQWIKSIKCIKSFEGAGRELYLDLIEEPLTYNDIKELGTLLSRYKIDMTQLLPLRTEENKYAFDAWKRQIFKKKKKSSEISDGESSR